MKKSKSVDYTTKKPDSKTTGRTISNVFDVLEKQPEIAKKMIDNSKKPKTVPCKTAKTKPINHVVWDSSPAMHQVVERKEVLYKLLDELQKKTTTSTKPKPKTIKKKVVKKQHLTQIPSVNPIASPTKAQFKTDLEISAYEKLLADLKQNHAESEQLIKSPWIDQKVFYFKSGKTEAFGRNSQ